jgi:hypothetical protein
MALSFSTRGRYELQHIVDSISSLSTTESVWGTDPIISVLSPAVYRVDACIRKPLPVIQVNIVPKFTEE